jgi:murein DD-endopeptidase MepM/ murein hydrolase activator NlpD
VTKNVVPSSLPEQADEPQGPATIMLLARVHRAIQAFSRWVFCPYKRVLIKIVPHHSKSVYKVEVSHLHLALATVAGIVVTLGLIVAHVADVHAAQAHVRALQAVEARQHQELNAFSRQTTILWRQVDRLQRDDEEIRRLTKVIVPRLPTTGAHPKAATLPHKQFSSADPLRLSPWKEAELWLASLGGSDGLGFAAEASELSSLSDAVNRTGAQTTALERRIRAIAEAKVAAQLARERELAAIPSIWPTMGYISSGFGYRSYPDYEFHAGLDIVNDYGAPIYATAAGVVVEAGWYEGYGYRVIIDHGNGLRSMYAHASRLFVTVGDTVRKGEEIAAVGATGFATGPHCHYQLELWGKPIDPTPYLNGSVKVVGVAR